MNSKLMMKIVIACMCIFALGLAKEHINTIKQLHIQSITLNDVDGIAQKKAAEAALIREKLNNYLNLGLELDVVQNGTRECADGETELTLTMNDAYGDGWNGNTFCIGDDCATLDGVNDDGLTGTAMFCVDMTAANNWTCGGGSWASEVSWTLSGDGVDLSGGAPESGCFGDGCGGGGEECDEGLSAYSFSCDGGSWQSEVSWTLNDAVGNEVAAGGAPLMGDLCLADGTYTLNMVDSYGDGWNGNAFTISDADGNTIATCTLDSGTDGTCDITVGGEPPVSGCMDPGAPEYNPDATLDDGSCWADCAGNTGWIADGYCDNTSNNNEGCGWDGGDCCGSTCETTDLYDCSSTSYGACMYECLDPSANDDCCADLSCGFFPTSCEDDGLYTCWDGSCAASEGDCPDTPDGCWYDYTNYGSASCDTAWDEYGLDCATLEANYTWDCSGCECPGDGPSCEEQGYAITCWDGSCADLEEDCPEYSCPDGQIEDCIGQCGPESWMGDGLCDDGSWGIYFNCEELGCDAGDCIQTDDPYADCYEEPADIADPPTGFGCEPGYDMAFGTAVVLTWDASDGADTYNVYYENITECGDGTCDSDETYDTCPEDCLPPGECGDGEVEDCADDDCCPESWIGDGFADCEDQAYGCDLTCYDNDGGDCEEGGTTTTTGGSEVCEDCLYDFTPYGAECCDAAWDAFGIDCATLEANYSWDCTGCSCPGDGGDSNDGPVHTEDLKPYLGLNHQQESILERMSINGVYDLNVLRQFGLLVSDVREWLLISSTVETTMTITGVTAGQEYTFGVSSVNTGGESEMSTVGGCVGGELEIGLDPMEDFTAAGAIYDTGEAAVEWTWTDPNPAEACAEGYVDDCSGDGDCCIETWIGDGFPDCEDQQWGCDLTCYDNDGGDCDEGGTTDTTTGGDECTGNTSWIADGWCDSINNNEACDFDGGDCCPCTCVDSTYLCSEYGGDCDDCNVAQDAASVCPDDCGGGDAGSDSPFANYTDEQMHQLKLIREGKVNIHTPTIVNTEGEILYQPAPENRQITYELAAYCDACLEGGEWSYTWTGITGTEFLVYGFDMEVEVCGDVRGVSDVNGASEWATGACALAGVEGPTCVAGDANDDGSVNVTDIVSIVNLILSGGATVGDAVDAGLTSCSDYNGDGMVNVTDIVSVVNYILAGGTAKADPATSAVLNNRDGNVSLSADGSVDAVQMTLTHGNDFAIELTHDAMVAEYKNHGDKTILVIVVPETDHLFTAAGSFTISEVIVANMNGNIDVAMDIPSEFSVSDAYPNPFNPVTNLNLTLPSEVMVDVKVYSVTGQVVDVITSRTMAAGYHTLEWDASDLSSGMYFIRTEAGENLSTQKVMLLK